MQFISPILEIGLSSILLLIFIKFFFDKDKLREKQFEKKEELILSEGVKREIQYKEREKMLLAESARREEILKKESEKREKILREEADRRETSLLLTIEGFNETMREISNTMIEIKKNNVIAQIKLENIENYTQNKNVV